MKKVLVVCIFSYLHTFTFAYSASVNMLSCCPGEDTATQARFVWHSDSDACLLFCAKASNPASYTVVPYRKRVKPVAFRSADVAYCKYEASISDLEPGTEYVYWVEIGSEKFPEQRFKTAGTGGSFNFLQAPGRSVRFPQRGARLRQRRPAQCRFRGVPPPRRGIC